METKTLSSKKSIATSINKALYYGACLDIKTLLENVGFFKPYDNKNFVFKNELWSKKDVYKMCVNNPYIFIEIK